jgi:hypothetical protein
MNIFFSRSLRLAQVTMAVVVLCLSPNGHITGEELSPVTKELFKAINNGDLAQVQISIANGANYKAANAWGISPIDLAVDKGHIKIVHYLLKISEIQTPNGKLPSMPTSAEANLLSNPTKAPAQAEPSPPVPNELRAVAEVYSPPPDSGPWSATVVTSDARSNMTVANPSSGVTQSKSALKQIARNFPHFDPVELGTTSPPKRSQVIRGRDANAMSIFLSNKEIKADKQKKSTVTKKGANWRKKESQPAQILPKRPSKKTEQKLPEKRLKGVILKIGRMTALNKTPPPQASKPKFYQSCINKKLGSLIFCVENLNWPESIRTFFLTDSILSKDTHTIVRYDGGVATYFHTLFPSKSYTSIINYFTQRFGAPTKNLERSIAPLAEKRRINPTAIWQRITPETNLLTTLEVRMYDDNRGDFPDTKRGAVYLYNEKSQSVFPHVSLVELMLLRAEDKQF